jgi:hypothetical protein
MSEQKYAELYERLVAGKKKKPSAEQVFLRGWNAGIDFAIKQMKLTCDEVIEDESISRETIGAAE